MQVKRVELNSLSRVEGQGRVVIEHRNGEPCGVRLEIFEPPRFFEALLRGRHGREAPDITARICGICPVAYQVTALNALESHLGIVIPERAKLLRRALYCAEWISSHALHIFFLHAPDLFGVESAFKLVTEQRGLLEGGVKLKALGARLLQVIGGREVHPINARIGGFYKLPQPDELHAFTVALKEGVLLATEAFHRFSQCIVGSYQCGESVQSGGSEPVELVSLRNGVEYPIERGEIVTLSGLHLQARQFEEYFVEYQMPHSTALRSRLLVGGGREDSAENLAENWAESSAEYLTGPLARFSLNSDLLPAEITALAREGGVTAPCYSRIHGILIRLLEVAYCCNECLRLFEAYAAAPAVRNEEQEYGGQELSGTAWGVSEAPRGILYHRYVLDEAGVIRDAKLVPPTAQNLAVIESELLSYVRSQSNTDEQVLVAECERIVRRYDPCISCATHFLELTVIPSS